MDRMFVHGFIRHYKFKELYNTNPPQIFKGSNDIDRESSCFGTFSVNVPIYCVHGKSAETRFTFEGASVARTDIQTPYVEVFLSKISEESWIDLIVNQAIDFDFSMNTANISYTRSLLSSHLRPGEETELHLIHNHHTLSIGMEIITDKNLTKSAWVTLISTIQPRKYKSNFNEQRQSEIVKTISVTSFSANFSFTESNFLFSSQGELSKSTVEFYSRTLGALLETEWHRMTTCLCHTLTFGELPPVAELNCFQFHSISVITHSPDQNKTTKMYVFHIKLREKPKIVFGIGTLYLTQNSIRRISWKEASDFCESTQFNLPILRSSEELSELMCVIQKSSSLPLVEAIFLGLKLAKKTQVRCKFSNLYHVIDQAKLGTLQHAGGNLASKCLFEVCLKYTIDFHCSSNGKMQILLFITKLGDIMHHIYKTENNNCAFT